MAPPDENFDDVDVRMLPELITTFMNDEENRFKALQKIRRLLSFGGNPPFQEVIDAGLIPPLLHLLQNGYDAMKLEAAWTLTNIASGASHQTAALVEQGAVPILVKSLRCPDKNVVDQCVWALGNIAGDSSEFRDLILSENAMEDLLYVLRSNPTRNLLRQTAWAISNLCRGKRPRRPDWDLIKGAVPFVCRLLYCGDDNVVSDACWAVSYLCDGQEFKINTVTNQSVVPQLVKLLGRSETKLRTPALRALGNIISGNEVHTQLVIRAGIMEPLANLLHTSQSTQLKEVCWMLSNIAAGTESQVKHLYDYPVLDKLLYYARQGPYYIKRECLYTLTNSTSNGSPEVVQQLVNNGILKVLVDELEEDVEIITICLGAIENILSLGQQRVISEGLAQNPYYHELETYGGVQTIRTLESHNNEKIFSSAYDITKKYFETETNAGYNFGDNSFNASNLSDMTFSFN